MPRVMQSAARELLAAVVADAGSPSSQDREPYQLGAAALAEHVAAALIQRMYVAGRTIRSHACSACTHIADVLTDMHVRTRTPVLAPKTLLWAPYARWVSQVPQPQDQTARAPFSRLCATAQSHGPAPEPLPRSVPIVDSWLPWTAPARGPPGAMAEEARHSIDVPSSDCSNGDRVCGMLP